MSIYTITTSIVYIFLIILRPPRSPRTDTLFLYTTLFRSIHEGAGEDIWRLSGAGDGDINEPIRETYSARVRWLIANLGTALVASSIVGVFGGAIEHMVALAALMPIVAGVGGTAGTQTLAVTVRALAMNQLTDSNSRSEERRVGEEGGRKGKYR